MYRQVLAVSCFSIVLQPTTMFDVSCLHLFITLLLKHNNTIHTMPNNTSYISAEGGKRRKIEIASIAPASHSQLSPPSSSYHYRYRTVKRGAKRAKVEVTAGHIDVIPFENPPAQPSRSINKKPSSKRGRSDSESEAGFRPTKKSRGVTLDTPQVSKKTRSSTKRAHSPAEGQVSGSPTRKRSRKSSAGLATKEADDDNDDDCSYHYSSESSNEDSSQEDDVFDEEDGELFGLKYINEAATNADVAATATKIQSQFRGYVVRRMKPPSQPLQVPNEAAGENDDDESINIDGTAALILVKMRSDQDSAGHSFDSNDEESNGFSAANDVEDDDIESVDLKGAGNIKDDDGEQNTLLLVQIRSDQVSARHSFHSNDEESKDFSAADNVKDDTSTTAEEAAPPTKRKRSLERLKSNLRCTLDGVYWTRAPIREVKIRRG